MTVQKYTKKPVTIEATQWDGTVEEATRIIDWILSGGGKARYHEEIPEEKKVWEPDGKSYEIIEARPALIYIDTLEGLMRADKGDFIIRGIKGEFYSCKSDIFEMTYVAAPDAEADAEHIATFDPPTVLALLDLAEKAKGLEAERGVQHLWRFQADDTYATWCGDPEARAWFPETVEQSDARPVCTVCHKRAMHWRYEQQKQAEAALARMTDDSMAERIAHAFMDSTGWKPKSPATLGAQRLGRTVLATIRAVAAGEQTEAMRCPGCDADPNAPHNGNGDCRRKQTEGGDRG